MSEINNAQITAPSWFEENPSHDHIPSETRRLLETWSGIPSDDVLDHVIKLRDEAWKVHPYPCIGQFRFLEPSFSELPDEYDEIVERIRKGQKLLDMACCFGQTIRQLANDGAPTENIYGCDLQPDFIELGYSLFRDRAKLKTKFLVADIFDSKSALTDVKGQIDIIYAGSFFHLWGYEKQVEVSKAVVALLRPQPGSMILGRQVGATEPLEKDGPTGTMYRHNVESFKRMWKEIGDNLGIKFNVEAKLKPLSRDHLKFHLDNTKRLWDCNSHRHQWLHHDNYHDQEDYSYHPADNYSHTYPYTHSSANAHTDANIEVNIFISSFATVVVFIAQAIIVGYTCTAFFHSSVFDPRFEPISTTPAYYFESSGTKNTFDACSALCKADSKCKSFGYGEANCMLFDVTAAENTNYNPMSPYTFYDAACPAELPVRKRQLDISLGLPGGIHISLGLGPGEISSACSCFITKGPASTTVTRTVSSAVVRTSTVTSTVTRTRGVGAE
ncbi:unnamed protein product [Alternaria alternata]